MNRPEIVEGYASGKLSYEEAMSLLEGTGVSKDDAKYELRSLRNVDVR